MMRVTHSKSGRDARGLPGTKLANSPGMSSQQVSESSSNANDADQLRESTSSETIVSTASELAFLQQVISSSESTEEGTDGDIFELLKRLDSADGVAQGVESKLDKLLDNLEGLLEGLEAS
jgi:hypothetical protein